MAPMEPIWWLRGCFWVSLGLHMVARKLHMAAHGVHMAAQRLHMAAHGPYMVAQRVLLGAIGAAYGLSLIHI